MRNRRCRDGVAVGNGGQSWPAGRTVARRPTAGVLAVRTIVQDGQHGRSVNHGSRRDPPPPNDAASVAAAAADADASLEVTASRSDYTSRSMHDTQTGGKHSRCPRVSALKRRRAAGRPQLQLVRAPPSVQAAGDGAAARRRSRPLAQTADVWWRSHGHRVTTRHLLLHVVICCKLFDSEYDEQSLKNHCEDPMGCVPADDASSAVSPASVWWLLLGDFVATPTQRVSPRSRRRGLLGR